MAAGAAGKPVQYLAITDLQTKQHYKDRRPPWIKLHVSRLDDYEFGRLPTIAKCHLMLLELLASKLDNRIPWDQKWIQKQIGVDEPVELQLLVDTGFIYICHQDASIAVMEENDGASNMLANCKQSDIVKTETETETETEAEAEATTTAAPASIALTIRQQDTSDPLGTAREVVAASLAPGSRTRFTAMCDGWTQGMGLPPGLKATAEDIELACNDYLINNPTQAATPAVMRAFVVRVIRDRANNASRPPPKPIGAYSRPNGRVSRNEQQYIDSRIAVGLPPYPDGEANGQS